MEWALNEVKKKNKIKKSKNCKSAIDKSQLTYNRQQTDNTDSYIYINKIYNKDMEFACTCVHSHLTLFCRLIFKYGRQSSTAMVMVSVVVSHTVKY